MKFICASSLSLFTLFLLQSQGLANMLPTATINTNLGAKIQAANEGSANNIKQAASQYRSSSSVIKKQTSSPKQVKNEMDVQIDLSKDGIKQQNIKIGDVKRAGPAKSKQQKGQGQALKEVVSKLQEQGAASKIDISKKSGGLGLKSQATLSDLSGYKKMEQVQQYEDEDDGLGGFNLIKGWDNAVTGSQNTVIGRQNNAYGILNYLEGMRNSVKGVQNMAIGDENNLIGANNMIHGNTNYAEGISNIVAGTKNYMKGNQNIALGHANMLRGHNNAIEGVQNTVQGLENAVIGQKNYLQGIGNVAVGLGNKITGQANYAKGAHQTVTGIQNRVLGLGNIGLGIGNYIEGEENIVQGKENAVKGIQNQVKGLSNKVVGQVNAVSGINNVAIGIQNSVNGHQNLVNGVQNVLNGNKDQVWGQRNTVNNKLDLSKVPGLEYFLNKGKQNYNGDNNFYYYSTAEKAQRQVTASQKGTSIPLPVTNASISTPKVSQKSVIIQKSITPQPVPKQTSIPIPAPTVGKVSAVSQTVSQTGSSQQAGAKAKNLVPVPPAVPKNQVIGSKNVIKDKLDISKLPGLDYVVKEGKTSILPPLGPVGSTRQ